MNAENFADFLKDYSKLYQLSYEELKSLVMQYPYCTNLHYLLLEKSQLDQHKDLDQITKTASFYSQDRAALRSLIQQLKVTASQMESFELTEDYLELKDLHSITPEMEEILAEEALDLAQEESDSLPSFFSVFSSSNVPDLPEEEEGDFTEEEGDYLDIPTFSENNQPLAPDDQSSQIPSQQAGDGKEGLFHQLMLDSAPEEDPTDHREIHLDESTVLESLDEGDLSPGPDPSSIIEPEHSSANGRADHEKQEEPSKSEAMEITNNFPADQPNQVQPTPKSSFSSWVQQFQPAHVKLQLGDLMESKKREDDKKAGKKKKKKKIKDKVVQFAERSLKEQKDLASETLAELLVSQEQYEKAIQMYERLMLKFPEKSGYFANKIKNLKNQ